MFMSPSYMLIFVIGMALSGLTALLVRIQFARGQKIPLASGLTGREVAARVLRDADISDVEIVEHQGFLSDHYNPMTKTLALSPDVFNGTSASAAGVAAHEVGHAIQHARGYAPMWLRSALVPLASVGGMFGPLLAMVGVMLGAAQQAAHGGGLGYTLALAGVILFGAAAAFSVVTVPVEFNASARARERLVALGITQRGAEDHAVRGVLLAAGLTYVAAAAIAIMNLLYWAARAGLLGGNRNN